MKVVVFIALFFTFHSANGQTQERIDLQRQKFVNDFMDAVMHHQSRKVLKFIDNDYKKEQLQEILNGNKKKFLNEMFSGDDQEYRHFVTVEFKNIQEILILRIEESSTPGEYNYWFTVEAELEGEYRYISCILLLKEKNKGKKTLYGFIGALG